MWQHHLNFSYIFSLHYALQLEFFQISTYKFKFLKYSKTILRSVLYKKFTKSLAPYGNKKLHYNKGE